VIAKLYNCSKETKDGRGLLEEYLESDTDTDVEVD